MSRTEKIAEVIDEHMRDENPLDWFGCNCGKREKEIIAEDGEWSMHVAKEIEKVLNAPEPSPKPSFDLDKALTPKFPKGTPEYAEYAAQVGKLRDMCICGHGWGFHSHLSTACLETDLEGLPACECGAFVKDES